MSTSWSASQQRILHALGYTLLRSAHAATAAVPTPLEIDPSDPLVTAVLRAAGLDADGVGEVCDWWHAQALPDPAALRADPAAKRSSWTRLRALRRRGP